MNQTTHKMTDPIQIKHYKEDITSFNQLYKEFQRRFVRFANTYVRDLTTAEDITIEAMMYYWENRQSLSEDSNIPAYILTNIKNKCLNYLRHQQIHEEYSDKIKDYYEWELNTRIATLQACEPYELFISEIQELVQQTIPDMPEKTRTIYMLSRYENKSYKEIAVHMNITPKGVDFHINTALKMLQTNLKDYFPLFLYFFMKCHKEFSILKCCLYRSIKECNKMEKEKLHRFFAGTTSIQEGMDIRAWMEASEENKRIIYKER